MSEPIRLLLTGCSGAGKSTLLAALAARGVATCPEPGRRVIAQARQTSDAVLPWNDMAAFAERALAMAKADFRAAGAGPTLFDRGIIDAAVALEAETGATLEALTGGLRYTDPVLLCPPWTALYRTDADRRHGFDAALAEYHRITKALRRLNHQIIRVPRATVTARAAFVQAVLAHRGIR